MAGSEMVCSFRTPSAEPGAPGRSTDGPAPCLGIQPRDPTGIMNFNPLVPTPDGRAYAYSWHRALSDLYLGGGIAVKTGGSKV